MDSIKNWNILNIYKMHMMYNRHKLFITMFKINLYLNFKVLKTNQYTNIFLYWKKILIFINLLKILIFII